MKRIAIAFALIYVCTTWGSSAEAQPGYIGLYADGSHSQVEVINPGGFFPFTMWVWCLPGINGQIGAEFGISYPESIIQSTVTWSPDLSEQTGDLTSGVGVCYTACKYEWNWVCYQACYLTDTNPAFIELTPDPDSGPIIFTNCLTACPHESVCILNYLAINQYYG